MEVTLNREERRILESFWRSLVAREVAKQIEVVFKITGGVTKFLRAQLSENSRVLHSYTT